MTILFSFLLILVARDGQMTQFCKGDTSRSMEVAKLEGKPWETLWFSWSKEMMQMFRYVPVPSFSFIPSMNLDIISTTVAATCDHEEKSRRMAERHLIVTSLGHWAISSNQPPPNFCYSRKIKYLFVQVSDIGDFYICSQAYLLPTPFGNHRGPKKLEKAIRDLPSNIFGG